MLHFVLLLHSLQNLQTIQHIHGKGHRIMCPNREHTSFSFVLGKCANNAFLKMDTNFSHKVPDHLQVDLRTCGAT